MKNTIIIVTDSRCGESSAFNDMAEFRQCMLDGEWTVEDFESFMDCQEEPADVHEAELVRDRGESGLYVYEVAYNTGYGRYENRYVYYRVWDDGSVRFLKWLDYPADSEELDEMCKA